MKRERAGGEVMFSEAPDGQFSLMRIVFNQQDVYIIFHGFHIEYRGFPGSPLSKQEC